MVLMVHVSQEVRPLIETKVIEINRDLSDTEDGLPAVTVSVGAALCRDAQSPEESCFMTPMSLCITSRNMGGTAAVSMNRRCGTSLRAEPERDRNSQFNKEINKIINCDIMDAVGFRSGLFQVRNQC